MIKYYILRIFFVYLNSSHFMSLLYLYYFNFMHKHLRNKSSLISNSQISLKTS
jgi:hypothetical protein